MAARPRRRPAHDADALARQLAARAPEGGDVSLLNTTSGTTGLPKIVIHDQLRWFHFHRLAADVGHSRRARRLHELAARPRRLRPLDGAFHADAARRADGAHAQVRRARDDRCPRAPSGDGARPPSRPSSSCCSSPAASTAGAKLALRALFTGGEAVPERQARNFEIRTGASVLQFYGSNETGAVSATRPEDRAAQAPHDRGQADPRDAAPPLRRERPATSRRADADSRR